MASKLVLVPEPVISQKAQFFFKLLLSPWVARGFVGFSVLSGVSQGPFFLVYFFSSFLSAALAASRRTFFLTPTAFPLRPVVRVLCPLTFRPREWRIPFQVRMSFMWSMSALILRARSGPTK